MKAPSKGAPEASAPSKAEQPKFKAIWEPVNVKEDVKLVSVHFVTPEEGWVAGGRTDMTGGIVFHTRDGGVTWETQVGDLQSSDRPYTGLHFLSPTLGFAAQSTGNLLRTIDAKEWTNAGTVDKRHTDYTFTSADVGFVVGGQTIQRTSDGGRRWQPVYECRVKAEVNGLMRDMTCEFDKIFFMNANLGYAVSRGLEGGAGFVLAKTTDGGATWVPSVILPGSDAKDGGLWFTSENHGVLRTVDGKFFYTDDGGKVWTGASGQMDGSPAIEFADPGVGWMISYRIMTYTTDGGKHWLSRQIDFPAPVRAFSLVSRDCGYAVGEHGMAYKYRIVPIEYAVKGMLAAPAMPAK